MLSPSEYLKENLFDLALYFGLLLGILVAYLALTCRHLATRQRSLAGHIFYIGDNQPNASFKYVLTIYHGLQRFFPLADLYIKLVGAKRSSRVHRLISPQSGACRENRGGRTSFLIKEHHTLGRVQTIKLAFNLDPQQVDSADWWYVNYMTIHDIGGQRLDQYLVYKWLKASKLNARSDSVSVDEIAVSESFDLVSFGHLFHMTLNRLLVDMCPWFSILLPRYYSHLSKLVDHNLLLFIFAVNNLLNLACSDSDLSLSLTALGVSLVSTNLAILAWSVLGRVYAALWECEQVRKLDELAQRQPFQLKHKSSSDVADLYTHSAESLQASTAKYAAERSNYAWTRVAERRQVDECRVINLSNNSNATSALDSNYQHIDFIRHVISNRNKGHHLSPSKLPRRASDIEEIFWREQSLCQDRLQLKLTLGWTVKAVFGVVIAFLVGFNGYLVNKQLSKHSNFRMLWQLLSLECVMSGAVFLVEILVAATLNAMYFKNYSNAFVMPSFVEISSNKSAGDQIPSRIVDSLSRKPQQGPRTPLKARERRRRLERELMEGVVAIVLYLVLFSIIILVCNEHSSIEQRMSSNVYLRNLIHSETNWSKVSSFDQFYKWALNDAMPRVISDSKNQVNVDNDKYLHVKNDFYVLNAIRIVEFQDSSSGAEVATSAGRPDLFFNYYPFQNPPNAEALRVGVSVIRYENFAVERARLLTNASERPIRQVSLEANFFNNQSKIWTVLRARVARNGQGEVKTMLSLLNLRHFIYFDDNADGNGRFRLAFVLFVVLLNCYIIHEGYQLRELTFERGLLRGLFAYAWSFENLLDTTLISFSLVHLATLAYTELILRRINDSVGLLRSLDFVSLHHALSIERLLHAQSNAMIFIAFFKALNLFKLNPKTYLITDTLSACCVDLAVLLSFILSNYSVFGLISHALFSADDAQFESVWSAVRAFVFTIVKPLDFDALVSGGHASSLFCWHAVFWFYVQRTLINLVVSVIIAYFNQVRDTHEKTESEKTFANILAGVRSYFLLSTAAAD